MTSPRLLRLARRLRPQKVRVRLSLLYAGLFLGAGAVLLALTYGLLASNLPQPRLSTPHLTAQQARNVAAYCKTVARRTPTLKGAAPGAIAVPTPCKNPFAAAAYAAEQSQRDKTLRDLLWFSLLGLGVMTVVSGGIGWLMAGRVLRPVRSMTAAAQRASDQHLGERLRLTGPHDELKELADTFDEMLDRLDGAFASQRRFVANASHELRTPLTVMRTAIDVTLSKPQRTPEQLEAMADKIGRSVDEAEALIASLLTLAVSERGIVTPEPLDLATIAEDALEAAGPAIDARGLQVSARLDATPVVGERVLLERLVVNLLDNAVRHNVDRGWIHVVTASGAHGAELRVDNGGERIDAAAVSTLCEPFVRLAGRASQGDGFGLGLAIVQSVATAHRATIQAEARSAGGLSVRVQFTDVDLDEGVVREVPAPAQREYSPH